MTPRVAWYLSVGGLAFNVIGAALLVFCPPATMARADGSSTLVFTWNQHLGFYFGMLLFILGFVLQLIAQASQRP